MRDYAALTLAEFTIPDPEKYACAYCALPEWAHLSLDSLHRIMVGVRVAWANLGTFCTDDLRFDMRVCCCSTTDQLVLHTSINGRIRRAGRTLPDTMRQESVVYLGRWSRLPYFTHAENMRQVARLAIHQRALDIVCFKYNNFKSNGENTFGVMPFAEAPQLLFSTQLW